MIDRLRRHWPEYLMEGALLGTFMLSACVVTALLEHPASPLRQAIPNGAVRRALTGVAMGLTAIGLIYSPWGKRSGAHMNPATSLTFWRLGRAAGGDAAWYAAAHFAGAAFGVGLAAGLLAAVSASEVGYAATRPGPAGPAAAFLAETFISFGMMSMVLRLVAHPRLAPRTGLFAGALVALYIYFEAPISGMSMNPARSFGSGLWAGSWDSLWIYFTAPVLGMLLAAEVRIRAFTSPASGCAKLHHDNPHRCIFCGKAAETAGTLQSKRSF